MHSTMVFGRYVLAARKERNTGCASYPSGEGVAGGAEASTELSDEVKNLREYRKHV